MKSGYNVLWTDHALSELENTIDYLEKNWTGKEIKNFFRELDHTVELISRNPDLFQSSKKKNIRRAVIARYNNLYYRTEEDTVIILSLFSNRQDPNKIQL